MNTNRKSQNYLVNSKYNGERDQGLLRIAFRLARAGKKVLYIAKEAPESLPMDDEYNETLYRDILMNVIFSYSSDASQLINFLLDMRQFRPKPEVLVIDFLHTFYDDTFTSKDENNRESCLHEHFIECHMLITAALHSVVDIFTLGTANDVMSIICIDPQRHPIYQKFIQKFVDLYFYEDGFILTFDEFMRKFPL